MSFNSYQYSMPNSNPQKVFYQPHPVAIYYTFKSPNINVNINPKSNPHPQILYHNVY